MCPAGPKVRPMKRLVSVALLLAAVGAACNKAEQPSSGAPAAASATGLVTAGSTAPVIDTTAHTGEHVTLAAFKGKPVVLDFYPKDDTPGCTKEASEIRDAWESLKKTDAIVLGVSTDGTESHVAFANKYQLPVHAPARQGRHHRAGVRRSTRERQSEASHLRHRSCRARSPRCFPK